MYLSYTIRLHRYELYIHFFPHIEEPSAHVEEAQSGVVEYRQPFCRENDRQMLKDAKFGPCFHRALQSIQILLID